MLKGFRDFIMRGNVVDLAVGVVIGVAFGGVVTQFTESFLEPLIGLIGGAEVAGKIDLPGGSAITWGAFISAVIGFLMTAAVVYFLVVLPMNKLAEYSKRKGNGAAEPSEETLLLREIRDALLAQRSGDEPVSETLRPRKAR